jgi:hypothetical protein
MVIRREAAKGVCMKALGEWKCESSSNKHANPRSREDALHHHSMLLFSAIKKAPQLVLRGFD